MLTLSSEQGFGGGFARSRIALERSYRVHVLERDRLAFDTRFHPSARHATGVTLYASLAGWSQVAGMAPTAEPRAYLLAESEFERIAADRLVLRTWGAPSVTVELRLRRDHVQVPIGLAAGPVALSPGAWAALHELVRAGELARNVRDVLDALVDAGVVSAAVRAESRDDEPPGFARLWHALQPFLTDQAMATSVREVSRATGLSLRQLGRDTKDFARTFELGDGFRETARLLRVRKAILLLSAPHATATSVAARVGYRSLEAMERAFRDYRVPPPHVVRQAVRHPDDLTASSPCECA